LLEKYDFAKELLTQYEIGTWRRTLFTTGNIKLVMEALKERGL
jgi:hypothetical protein